MSSHGMSFGTGFRFPCPKANPFSNSSGRSRGAGCPNDDWGRNEGLNLAPPSKPDCRVSRIRLSSWRFLTLEIGSLVFGLSLEATV